MQNIWKNVALNGTKRGMIMSREIKFRIWDKINRMWLRCFNVNLFDIGDLPNVELMQYTGLKDKNGKEIYEGDIVILNDAEEENRCVVKYKYGSYILVDGDLRENLSNVEDRFLEVIGNIYENKNLLEENKWNI